MHKGEPFARLWLYLRSFHLRDIADDLDALVNAERAAVEADIVILGLAPVAVGVMLVIEIGRASCRERV